MEIKKTTLIYWLLWMFLTGMVLDGLLHFAFRETYIDGQIDALNGKVLYHLVKQENGELIWEHK